MQLFAVAPSRFAEANYFGGRDGHWIFSVIERC